jgi:hypothetical protein
MSGYVIEIGAKAKMAELAKTRLSDMTASMIWRVTDEWVYKNPLFNSIPNPEPVTMYEFGKYFLGMLSVPKNKDVYKDDKGKQLPELHNLLQRSTHYQSLSEGRVYDADNKEPFHAPPLFLRTVGKWAKLLGNQEACYSEFEKIADEFEKLKWGTSLRYGELEMNNPNEKSLKALSIAYHFLKISLLSDDRSEQARYLALGESLNLTTASV